MVGNIGKRFYAGSLLTYFFRSALKFIALQYKKAFNPKYHIPFRKHLAHYNSTMVLGTTFEEGSFKLFSYFTQTVL